MLNICSACDVLARRMNGLSIHARRADCLQSEMELQAPARIQGALDYAVRVFHAHSCGELVTRR